MLKKRNKVLSIFYFIFGVILFVPVGADATQNTEITETHALETPPAQENVKLPKLPAEPVALNDELRFPPIFHDIPAPIGAVEITPQAERQNKSPGGQE